MLCTNTYLLIQIQILSTQVRHNNYALPHIDLDKQDQT